MITFMPHTASVTALAFSPDGSHLASVSSDGSLKVWDPSRLGQGEPVWEVVKAHTGGVNHAQYAPDGSVIYTGGSDGAMKAWSAKDGAPRSATNPYEVPGADVGGVNAFVVSLCGKWVAYGGGSMWHPSEIVVADAATLTPLRRLPGHAAAVGIFGVHEGGFASGSADNSVRLWDWQTAACLGTLKLRGVIRGLTMPASGRAIAVAGGALIHLYDSPRAAGDPRNANTLRGHSKRVECIDFSPDGARLASSGGDGTIRVWDTATASELRVFAPRLGPLHWVAFARDGLTLAFSSRRGHVGVFDLDD